MNTIKLSKSGIIILLVLTLILLVSNSVLAEAPSESKTKSYITSVSKKFQDLKKSSDADSYIDEITSIDNYLRQAKQLFKDSKYEEAYYAAGIADTYFRLIEAKKEYNDSQKPPQ